MKKLLTILLFAGVTMLAHADSPDGGKCQVEYEWNGTKFVKK